MIAGKCQLFALKTILCLLLILMVKSHLVWISFLNEISKNLTLSQETLTMTDVEPQNSKIPFQDMKWFSLSEHPVLDNQNQCRIHTGDNDVLVHAHLK